MNFNVFPFIIVDGDNINLGSEISRINNTTAAAFEGATIQFRLNLYIEEKMAPPL